MLKRLMMIFLFVSAVTVCAVAQVEEEDGIIDEILSRSMVGYGANISLADDFSDFGYGAILGRAITFMGSATNQTGTYMIMFLGGPMNFKGPNGVSISDQKLIGAGWRGAPLADILAFDANAAVTMGSRATNGVIDGKDVSITVGSMYFGISPEVGLYIPYNSDIDVGLSFSPVFNVYNLGGANDIKNKTYYNISLTVNMKTLMRQQKYHWEKEDF